MSSASLRPNVDDMLRSQAATRQSKLLESRIRSSLLTIENWRREDLGTDELRIGDADTAPSTSCDSNDTLVRVVRYHPDGEDQELSQQSMEATQSEPVERTSNLTRRRQQNQDRNYTPNILGAKSEFQREFNRNKLLCSEKTHDKSRVDDKQKMNPSEKSKTSFSPPRYVIAKTSGGTELRKYSLPEESSLVPPKGKSKKTRGERIRNKKEYDSKLLESLRTKIPSENETRSAVKDPTPPILHELRAQRSAAQVQVRKDIQALREKVQDRYSDENESRPKLTTQTSMAAPNRRPCLERRVSQLLTMTDDIKGETILFPNARASQRRLQRSHSGKREKLITSTKQQQQVVSQKSRWFSNPLQSFQSRKQWRPISMRLLKKAPEKEAKPRSQSSRTVRETKRPSWDDVPDSSQFPPSFFGNPVVVATRSSSR